MILEHRWFWLTKIVDLLINKIPFLLSESNIKPQLHVRCVELVEQQVERLQQSIEDIQNASNNETKSSAGDKYETGRAMAQLEKDKLSQQLARSLSLRKVLLQINPNVIAKKIQLGSLVYTETSIFYFAVGLGSVEIREESVFVISPVSPIGKLLMNKGVGDSVVFNNKSYTILRVL